MAQVTKSVDKTLVNGSEIFIYTINVEYSELTQPSQSGKLIEFFPSKIQYTLPQIGGQIRNIIKTPVAGGTNITFDFGQVNAGTSMSFTIACSFGFGRVPNDTFSNIVYLYADNVQVAEAIAPTVTLRLSEDFILEKKANVDNLIRPEEELTFTLSIINKGDYGSVITDVNISDSLPAELTPITDYIPIGNDVPTSGYSDPTYNGRTGSFNGSILEFNLPRFSGARYDITFKARVSKDVTPGTKIINTAIWTVEGSSRPNAILDLTVFDENLSFGLRKTGSRTSYINGPVSYYITNENRSIYPLSDYILEDDLPAEVDINKLQFIANSNGIPKYSIDIAVSGRPGFISVLKDFTTGNSDLIDLSPFIPVGERVVLVRVEVPDLMVNNSSHSLYLYGTVNETATQDQRIYNTAIAYSGNIRTESRIDTNITGASDLSLVKGIIPRQAAYFPLEEFKFMLQGSALNTMTIEPIFADLMPNGLRYVLDSEYYEYVDSMTGITYDSRIPGFPVPFPEREIIENFANTGRTLLRWKFKNFVLPQRCNIRVYFTVFVEIDPPNLFTNQGYEGNPGNNVYHVYDPVEDTLDFDGDGITDEFISGREVSGVILTTSEFSIKKLVKGEKDLEYSESGTSLSGGNVDYRLYITNNQKTGLKDIEIIDILPYIGDRGVILTRARGSQFNVYATSSVSARIVNLIGEPVVENPEIIIEYSTGNDPIRFDSLGNIVGVDTWTTAPPTDITTLRSIKVTTGPNVILKSYERLIIEFSARVPTGVSPNLTAYNSFATRANQIVEGQIIPFLPTEPNKVALKIVSTAGGAIGDFVWEDKNGNGIYDDGEPGVNGITVELYNKDKVKIRESKTSNNVNGEAGYYLFSGLEAGEYQVKFIPYGDYILTTQRVDLINGSKPNPIDGFTNVITLLENQIRTDIDAGVKIEEECKPPIIIAKDRCIEVCDMFNPMKCVCAINCYGENITKDIKIVENTVNDFMQGIYKVTYQVTDSLNQTTRKTIKVIVC